jgi:hypothetical protein
MKLKIEIKGQKFQYIAKMQADRMWRWMAFIKQSTRDASGSRRGAGPHAEIPKGSAVKGIKPTSKSKTKIVILPQS